MLGQIANPAQADIVGALDYRQRKLEDDERKRKEIKMNQLIAEAMPGLNPDGKLFQIAQEDPQKYMMVAQVLGVPTNSGQLIQQTADDAAYLSSLPIRQSLEEANRIVMEREASGQNPGPIKKFLASAMRDGPKVAYEALQYMNGSLNNDADKARVQSSVNLPGGLTKTVDSRGNVAVRTAGGDVLKGEAAVKAIRDAEQRGVDLERDTYAAREGGKIDTQIEKRPELLDKETRATEDAKNATKTSKEYFDQLQNIQGNISNFDEGIRLLREEGANTGVLARRLPSLKASSQKLDNLKNRLGLDVVGGTTFGALSEKELQMAMDTGMPDNMKPEELATWFEQRRDAQQKLAGILDGAIQFLSIPGNSLADLREMQKSDTAGAQQGQPAQSSQNQPVGTPKAINWSDM